MKIAVSAAGKDLDSLMDERFGRCRYFIIVDTDDMNHEVLVNDNADLSTGAGVQAATLLVSKDVDAVITGNCGPKAMRVFDAAAIPLTTGQQGIIKEVVDAFKQGGVNPVAPANRDPAAGSRPRQYPPKANWPSRGMVGGGCGRGMGRQCAPADGSITPVRVSAPRVLSRDAQLARLRQRAEDLQRQMAAIHSEIEHLS